MPIGDHYLHTSPEKIAGILDRTGELLFFKS
jgi:hypothetical protein